MARWARKVFTASGSFVVPSGITHLIIQGVGGGGGGGGGQNAATVINVFRGGGGGGGAAIEAQGIVSVTPNETLTVEVGAGGAGGTGGASPTAGARGADTRLLRGATILACFNGADGGRPGITAGSAPGGLPSPVEAMYAGGSLYNGFHLLEGRGGYGSVTSTSGPVAGARQKGSRLTACPPGAQGTHSSTWRGGGGGGGGGGGTFDDVGGTGAGGKGGDANNSGIGEAGGNGARGQGYGGGGGGGGAGGAGTPAATGGNGGDGMSGRLILYWVEG